MRAVAFCVGNGVSTESWASVNRVGSRTIAFPFGDEDAAHGLAAALHARACGHADRAHGEKVNHALNLFQRQGVVGEQRDDREDWRHWSRDTHPTPAALHPGPHQPGAADALTRVKSSIKACSLASRLRSKSALSADARTPRSGSRAWSERQRRGAPWGLTAPRSGTTDS